MYTRERAIASLRLFQTLSMSVLLNHLLSGLRYIHKTSIIPLKIFNILECFNDQHCQDYTALK